jgi:hypothetical protein
MKRKRAVAAAAGLSVLALLAGCESSKSAAPDQAAPARASDATVKRDFLRGVSQIRSSQREKLRGQLVSSLARLRRDQGSTAVGRRARRLAIQGFTWTVKGVDADLAFYMNDSGNIEAAVRDAKRADRNLNRGANLLRAAGRAFGLRIGKLNGR